MCVCVSKIGPEEFMPLRWVEMENLLIYSFRFCNTFTSLVNHLTLKPQPPTPSSPLLVVCVTLSSCVDGREERFLCVLFRLLSRAVTLCHTAACSSSRGCGNNMLQYTNSHNTKKTKRNGNGCGRAGGWSKSHFTDQQRKAYTIKLRQYISFSVISLRHPTPADLIRIVSDVVPVCCSSTLDDVCRRKYHIYEPNINNMILSFSLFVQQFEWARRNKTTRAFGHRRRHRLNLSKKKTFCVRMPDANANANNKSVIELLLSRWMERIEK